jgi:hypothetical protein
MSIRVMTPDQSALRVKYLRKHGYKVKRIRLSDGSIVVLKRKGRITSACHHCKKKKRRRR